MDTTTLGLKKPLQTEAYDVQVQNDNMDAINGLITADRTNITANASNLTKAQADNAYKLAGGTSTALTATISGTLVDGYPVNVQAKYDNSGAATTLNTKPIYKPGTTTAPTIKANSLCTFVYNLAGDCFFIKASGGGGTANVGDVLAGVTFSSDNVSDGTGTLALTGSALVADVLAGQTFYNTNAKTKVTGTMPDNGAVTITPGTADQAIALGKHNGSGKVLGDANLASGNIKSGVSIFGVAGNSNVVNTSDANALAAQLMVGVTSYVQGTKITGTLADYSDTDQVASAGTSVGTSIQLTVPNTGKYGAGKKLTVTDANMLAENIKQGVSILGKAGSFTSDANAGAGDLGEGKTAYVNGVKVTGTSKNYNVGDFIPKADNVDFFVQSSLPLPTPIRTSTALGAFKNDRAWLVKNNVVYCINRFSLDLIFTSTAVYDDIYQIYADSDENIYIYYYYGTGSASKIDKINNAGGTVWSVTLNASYRSYTPSNFYEKDGYLYFYHAASDKLLYKIDKSNGAKTSVAIGTLRGDKGLIVDDILYISVQSSPTYELRKYTLDGALITSATMYIYSTVYKDAFDLQGKYYYVFKTSEVRQYSLETANFGTLLNTFLITTKDPYICPMGLDGFILYDDDSTNVWADFSFVDSANAIVFQSHGYHSNTIAYSIGIQSDLFGIYDVLQKAIFVSSGANPSYFILKLCPFGQYIGG